MTTSSTIIIPDIRVTSINVRGINNITKRNILFNSFKKSNSDIIFAQETYSNTETCVQWNDEWGGKCIFSHGSNHSRGVAILFKRGLDFIITREKCDPQGRYIMCEVSLNDNSFILLNVYGPNIYREQVYFFNELISSLRDFNTSNINMIIAGDWNIVLNPALDKRGGIGDARRNI